MANEEAKLFVAGLPDSISEEVLKQLFEATGGKVVGVSLPKDRLTGRPRGFGFVTLATPQEAQAARDALDGSMQAGKSISVRPFQAEPPRRDAAGRAPTAHGRRRRGRAAPGARSRRPTAPSTSATSRTTRRRKRCRSSSTAPSPDGVVRVHLPMDADGRKRGFGFVTMASPEAAKTAADALRAGRPSRPPPGREPRPSQGRAARAADGRRGRRRRLLGAPSRRRSAAAAAVRAGPPIESRARPRGAPQALVRGRRGPRRRGKRGEREERGGANSRIDYGSDDDDK